MELAVRTCVIAHLIFCVLTLLLLAVVLGPAGVVVGLGVAAFLAFAIPFIVLPVAAAIGFFSHMAFHGTGMSLPTLIRILVILFEATLFGWVLVMVAALH